MISGGKHYDLPTDPFSDLDPDLVHSEELLLCSMMQRTKSTERYEH
eukprot:CAMPEP_0195249860 /NCGR_PEP_ID=MMETSP0706-20130129/2369_1 /TAXON_ID=33640 /ORGANISM="Asterionellopsis glacialis, Strain CCMP134" /LENGTH=45 /DNA_ID= /DNA_START= /DNA_END= /DNA_ORIENTATION=